MAQLSMKDAREFMNALNSFAILDANGRYTYVSENWCRMTNCTEENALGRRVEDIVPDTLAHQVYETGQPVFGHPVVLNDVTMFTNYIPRFSADKKVVGCFLYTIVHGAREAMQLEKQLQALSEKVEDYQKRLSREHGAKYSLENIIGESPEILHLKNQIRQAAASSSTVLIEGETGTGKELIAHSIHTLSPRATSDFVRVNCSAIPEDLMESEFFGYTSGAFTGALKDGKKGRFLVANHGSIFLDEVNLLPVTMQPKFLRVLQEHEVTPVGSADSVPIDIRVIAATNKSLLDLVEKGAFRMDLYFRLNVIRIQAPALRKHKQDIPLLVENMIEKLNREMGTFVQGIEPEALNFLMKYDWPGNIRELQNYVEVAMNNATSPILTQADFIHSESFKTLVSRYSSAPKTTYNLRLLRMEFEKNIIQEVLQTTHGNKQQAAKMMGISRTVLYEKLKEHGLI